jgi:hypothetical protein
MLQVEAIREICGEKARYQRKAGQYRLSTFPQVSEVEVERPEGVPCFLKGMGDLVCSVRPRGLLDYALVFEEIPK